MNLLFLNNIFTNELIRALCRTFLHSLWQGLLVALVTGIVITLTKKSRPALRYNLLVALFTFFILMVCFTFLKQFGYLTIAEENIVGNYQASQSASLSVNNFEGNRFQILISQLIGFFDRHAFLIFVFWFAIFSIKSVRLVFNLGYIQQIRRNNIYPPSEYWKNKVKELCNILQVHRPVSILESGIAKVPLTIGFLKPIILVPVGLLCKLTPGQAEVILLHELAHIRRRDYLVNILQSFAEAVFFFNPAVLWLSSLIREERENCCDDIAISVTGDKANYVKALLSFQEYEMNINKYAMAFPGIKNNFLNRMRRIIDGSNKKINGMEKIFLLFSITLIGFMVLSFSGSNHQQFQKKLNVAGSVPQLTVLQNENKLIDTSKETLQNNNSSSAIKKLHVTSKNPSEKEVFLQDREKIMADTIPANASKEFLAGYQAGSNYKNGIDLPVDERGELKKKIEQAQQPSGKSLTGITPYDQLKQKDAAMKKQIEERARLNN